MENTTNEIWLNKLFDRRVLQYVGSYLAVGFAVLQFLEFISNRYDWSEVWVDKYLFVWLSFLPAVLVFSFFKDQIVQATGSKFPKFFILGNLIVSLLLGILFFNGTKKEANTIVELTNEEGEKIQAIVPAQHRIKTLACFQFDNLTKDQSLDWWGVAFSQLLKFNLNQRPEFYTLSTYNLNGYYNRLNLPLFKVPDVGKQREIAQKSRSDYFSRIAYTIEQGIFIFTGQIYDTRYGKKLFDLEVKDNDPFVAIDELKRQIIQHIPDALGTLENQVDMPASALISSNTEALKFLTQSRIEDFNNPNKLDGVITLAKKAVALDPSCSLCHLHTGIPLYMQGQREESINYVKNAIRYGASLPQRMQFRAKSLLYNYTNNLTANIKLQELRRQMFPYEFGAYDYLVPIYKLNFGVDSTKALIQEAIDNGNVEKGLLEMYFIQISNEEFDAAEKTLDRLSKEFPDREEDRLKYVNLYEKQGRLTEAKELLLKEELLDPLDSEIQLYLAYIDFKNTFVAQASERLDRNLQSSTSTQDSLRFFEGKLYFLKETGQIQKALATLKAHEKCLLQRESKSSIIRSFYITKMNMYHSINQVEKAVPLLEELLRYSPEDEDYYRCMTFTNSLVNDYLISEEQQENHAYCETHFKDLGEGYADFVALLKAYQKKDYTACVEILDNGKTELRTALDMDYFMARIYALAGQLDKARTILQEKINQKTADPLYYYEMAALLEKEDPKAAQENLNIALKFWEKADDNYIYLQRAKDLAARLLQ